MQPVLKKITRNLTTYGLLIGLFSPMGFSQSLYTTQIIDSLKDADFDGVIDARDTCPNTPAGIDVDNSGCPLSNTKYFNVRLDIPFETASHTVKPEFYPKLEGLAKSLKESPGSMILIEGHTDNLGTEHFNLTLSKQRAQSIASVLSSTFGIQANRIKALGYGQERPIASNDTESGRMINRRVSSEIVAPLNNNNLFSKQPNLDNNETTITFKRNHYQIAPIDYPKIRSLGSKLDTNKESLIILEGHTDNSGSKTYNLTLSEKRATQVANIIQSEFTIPDDRIKTLGYGQTFPIASNSTKEGREKNRRVDTSLVQPIKTSQKTPIPRWTIWSVDQLDSDKKP